MLPLPPFTPVLVFFSLWHDSFSRSLYQELLLMLFLQIPWQRRLLIPQAHHAWRCLSPTISTHGRPTTFLPQRQSSFCRKVSSTGLFFTRHVSFLCIICSILQSTRVLIGKFYFNYYFSYFTDDLSGKSHSHAFLQHAFKIAALSSFTLKDHPYSLRYLAPAVITDDRIRPEYMGYTYS